MASIIVKNVSAVSESLEQMASYNQKLYQEVEAIGNVCNKISSLHVPGTGWKTLSRSRKGRGRIEIERWTGVFEEESQERS